MSKKTVQPTLENALSELAGITEKMEQDELSLEQSLEQFERGTFLVRHARKILEQAEQKVILLQEKNTKSDPE